MIPNRFKSSISPIDTGIVHSFLDKILPSVVTAGIGGILGGGGGGASQRTRTSPIAVRGGLFGDTEYDKYRKLRLNMDPRLEAIQNMALGQAGGYAGQDYSGLTDQAFDLSKGLFGQLQTYDPFAAAEQQFGRLEEILAPERERQRIGQESRLFSQGRLGSSGGALQQQALLEAQEQDRRRGLYESFSQAQDVQGQMLSRAMSAGLFGPQLNQQQQAMIQQALKTAFAPGAEQRALLSTIAPFAGATTTANVGGGFGSQVGQGLMEEGAGMLGDAITGLFNP